ncbi:hypothetical protein HRbin12_00433 [bacterium HR12]|nr:hypothetical protein HRbin12_00433 [bacterium HR12]
MVGGARRRGGGWAGRVHPPSGGLCRSSTAGGETEVWCGVGWTGQPHVIVGEGGRIEIRINAYDGGYHFLDAETRPW